MTVVDEEFRRLVRQGVRGALVRVQKDLSTALDGFGWSELAETDEGLAVTTLFEELGRQALDTNALDLVTTALLGVDGERAVIWPLTERLPTAGTGGGRGSIEGISLHPISSGGVRLFVWGPDGLHPFEATAITESALSGMAEGTSWMRVRAEGAPGEVLGDRSRLERRCRLAVSSELVGLAERTVDLAVEHVSRREQFGRPIGTYQSVRFRLAEAYAEVAGARALVASAWEDGSAASAELAHCATRRTHDTVAKHALQVCGAIGYSVEHPLPALVRRGFALGALVGGSSLEMIGSSLAPRPAPVGTF